MKLPAVFITASLFTFIPLGFAGGENALPVLTSVFDQPRSEKEDVIFFRNKDVLRGTVLNATLGINTPYGNVKIDLRKCAGVSFEGSRANTEAIVTVNRNRLTGIITDRVVRFRIGSSGEEIDIRKEKIRYILLRRSPKDLEFLDPKKPCDLFVMANGDLLTGKPRESKIVITTDYGSVSVAFDEMRKIEMQGGENVTAIITKANRDVMRGTLETEEITLQLDLGVAVEAVYKDKLARVFIDHVPEEMLGHFGALQPVQGESDGALTANVIPGTHPRELKLDLGEGVALEMVLIPAGEFNMGSPVLEEKRYENEPLHRVRITKPFYMAKYETTQAQWLLGMGGKGGNPATFTGLQNPVEQVSWDYCQDFITRLERLMPGRKFRLPTEAEWEYACRAGTSTRFSFGDSDSNLANHAWMYANSGENTHRVGTKRPNAWGLYDMHGNVWEWCADWYGEYEFSKGKVVSDPRGASSGKSRVLRGGSWRIDSGRCRSAYRRRDAPDSRRDSYGFRLVLDLK